MAPKDYKSHEEKNKGKKNHYIYWKVRRKDTSNGKDGYFRLDPKQSPTEDDFKVFDAEMRRITGTAILNAFREGASVTIHGLKGDEGDELNGQAGTLGIPDPDNDGRWYVMLKAT